MTTRSTATQEEDRLVEVAAGELTPLMIDWLTARLEGIQVEFDGIHIRHCPVPGKFDGDIYSPSTNPLDGHALLEREKIQSRYVESHSHAFDGLWMAQDCRFRSTGSSVGWVEYGHQYPALALGYLTGPTMLIAGLRFILAKHLVGKRKNPMVRVPAKLIRETKS